MEIVRSWLFKHKTAFPFYLRFQIVSQLSNRTLLAFLFSCALLFGGTFPAAYAACGNGILESGEACDDGNAIGGDGCGVNSGQSGLCNVEWGWRCNNTTSPSTCLAPCSTTRTISNSIVSMKIGFCSNGLISAQSLKPLPNGSELLVTHPTIPNPSLVLIWVGEYNTGAYLLPKSIADVPGQPNNYLIGFKGSNIQIQIAIIPHQKYFTFKLVNVMNPLNETLHGVEFMHLQWLSSVTEPGYMDSIPDSQIVLDAWPITVEADCNKSNAASPYWYGSGQLGCKVSRHVPMNNAAGALMTSTKGEYTDVMEQVVIDHQDGNADGTAKMPYVVLSDGQWLRKSRVPRESYLFTSVHPENYEDLAEFASHGKFKHLTAVFPTWEGRYSPINFPGTPAESRQAFINAMHYIRDYDPANLVELGIDVYFNSMDPREGWGGGGSNTLFSLSNPPGGDLSDLLHVYHLGDLATSIGPTNTSFTLNSNLSQHEYFKPFVIDGIYGVLFKDGFLIGNEYVTCPSHDSNFTISNCARGWQNLTTASSHPAGTPVYWVMKSSGSYGFLLNPNDAISNEGLGHFASLANDLGVTHAYLEGQGTVFPPSSYLNGGYVEYTHKYGSYRAVEAIDSVMPLPMFQYATGVGRFGAFTARRTASEDAVKWDPKAFMRGKVADILTADTDLLSYGTNPYMTYISEFALWAFNGARLADGKKDVEATDRNEVHYVMNKVLGFNLALGVQDGFEYQKHALLLSLFDIIGVYHELIDKIRDGAINLSSAMTDWLKAVGNEAELHKLVNHYHFVRTTIDRQRYASWTPAQSYQYSVNNPYASQKIKRLAIRPRFDFYDYNDSQHSTITVFTNPGIFSITKSPGNITCTINGSGVVTVTNNNAAGSAPGGCKLSIYDDWNFTGKRGLGLSMTKSSAGQNTELVVLRMGPWPKRDSKFLIDFTGQKTLIGFPTDDLEDWVNGVRVDWQGKIGRDRHWDISYDSIGEIAILINNVLPQTTSTLQLHSLKALKEKGTSDLVNPSVTINGNTVTFPVTLKVDDTSPNILEYNGFTHLYDYYTSNYEWLGSGTLPGTAPVLNAGNNTVSITSDTFNPLYSRKADVRIQMYDDRDGDGVPDNGRLGTEEGLPCHGTDDFCNDNCPTTPNPEQVDSNGNGIGNACETPTNNPPIFYSVNGLPGSTSPFHFSAAETQTIQFTTIAQDSDTSNTVTQSVVGTLPSGATFTGTPGNPSTYTFNWTPTYAQSGDYYLTLKASDGSLIATQTIQLHISDVPPPTLTLNAPVPNEGNFTLNWSPASGSTIYQVQLSTDPFFIVNTNEMWTNGFSQVYNSLAAGNYFARVQAWTQLPSNGGVGTGFSNLVPFEIFPAGPFCGNGVVEAGEICEVGSYQACVTSEGYSGTQFCPYTCDGYDTCASAQYCGDGIINGSEQCDATALNNQSCTSQGLGTGTLSCAGACTFDISQCSCIKTYSNNYTDLVINTCTAKIIRLMYQGQNKLWIGGVPPTFQTRAIAALHFKPGAITGCTVNDEEACYKDASSMQNLGNDVYRISFAGTAETIDLEIKAAQVGYYTFKVVAMSNPNLIQRLKFFDIGTEQSPVAFMASSVLQTAEWAKNAPDDELFVRLMPLNSSTPCTQPGFPWKPGLFGPRHTCVARSETMLVGAAGAFQTGPKSEYWNIGEQIVLQNNLPYSVGSDGKWIYKSDQMRESYFFANLYDGSANGTTRNVEQLLDLTARGHFPQMVLQSPLAMGAYQIPLGIQNLSTMKSIFDQFRAAGTKVGIHTFFGHISPLECYVNGGPTLNCANRQQGVDYLVNFDNPAQPLSEWLDLEQIGTLNAPIGMCIPADLPGGNCCNTMQMELDHNLDSDPTFQFHFNHPDPPQRTLLIGNELFECITSAGNKITCTRQPPWQRSGNMVTTHAAGTPVYLATRDQWYGFLLKKDKMPLSVERFKNMVEYLDLDFLYQDGYLRWYKYGEAFDDFAYRGSNEALLPYLTALNVGCSGHNCFPRFESGGTESLFDQAYANATSPSNDGVMYKQKEFTYGRVKSFDLYAPFSPYNLPRGTMGWWRVNGSGWDSSSIYDYDATSKDDLDYVMVKQLAFELPNAIQTGARFEEPKLQGHLVYLFDEIGKYMDLAKEDIHGAFIPQNVKDALRPISAEAEISVFGNTPNKQYNLISKKTIHEYAAWSAGNDYVINTTNPYGQQKLKFNIRARPDYKSFTDPGNVLLSDFNISPSNVTPSHDGVTCNYNSGTKTLTVTNTSTQYGGCKLLLQQTTSNNPIDLRFKRILKLRMQGDNKNEQVVARLANEQVFLMRDFKFLVDFSNTKDLVLGDATGDYEDVVNNNVVSTPHMGTLWKQRNWNTEYNRTITSVLVFVNNIAPNNQGGTYTLRFESLHALAEKPLATARLVDPKVTIGNKTISFPVMQGGLGVGTDQPYLLEYDGYTREYKVYSSNYELLQTGTLLPTDDIDVPSGPVQIKFNSINGTNNLSRADIHVFFKDDVDNDGWASNGNYDDSYVPCNGSNSFCDDNCPGVANPDQLDADGDGVGNACDDNNAPVIQSVNGINIGNQSLLQMSAPYGQLFTFVSIVSDADPGELVTQQMMGLPPGAIFTGLPGNPSIYTFTWLSPQAGFFNLTLQASDGTENTVLPISLGVMNLIPTSPTCGDSCNTNSAPVIQSVNGISVGSQESLQMSAPYDELFTFVSVVSDADAGDSVTQQMTGLPPGAVFTGTPGNPSIYTFTWLSTQQGLFNMTLQASDGTANTTLPISLGVIHVVPVAPVCGDGIVSPQYEACDDHNSVNGDGCSSTCTIEPGYTCSGSPSVCTNNLVPTLPANTSEVGDSGPVPVKRSRPQPAQRAG